MLRNVLIVKLDKLYTVNLYVSLSALYMLQYVPIVTYSCKLLYSKKKKKKKTRTSVWVKIPKLCHNTPLSIFSLGKGRESLRLKTLHKNYVQVRFLPCPQHAKRFRFGQCMDDVRQNCPKISIFSPQISHLSSNRRVRNLAFYFQFTTPARKLTHRMKFEHVWMQKDMNFGNAIILRHFRPEKCENPTQKDTNFGNTIILHYLGPENCQIQPQKTLILHRTALIDPSKISNKIRKVFLFEMHSLTPSTLTNQPHWEHLIARILQLQTNCDTFGQ